MIFDKIRRTYSSIQWGLFVFVLICPFLSFAQGFINYQAFIYEKFNIVQPGRDNLEQMVPYASKRVYVWVELINEDTSLFNEEHQDVLTDSMGMLNLRIGSKESDLYKNIPWSRLSQDKVFLKISWSQTISGPRDLIENSLLSVSPFSIKSIFTELSDSSRRAVNADTAIFSKNAIRRVDLEAADQSLIFNLHNGDTLRSPSLANIPKPTIVSLRPGSICKGDSVFLYSGPVPDTRLFKSFWVTLSSPPDTLDSNVSSIKIVVNTDTQVVFGIQRLSSIAGLPTTSADTINLKVTNFSNLIDSISQDTIFEKYAFCVHDSLILPSISYSKGTWRCLNPNLAEINSSYKVKFKNAGQLTLGFFPYNGCPFDVFYFNCTVTKPPSAGTLGGTQSICVNGTTTFASTVSGGSWSSSAVGVATVNDSTGVVTGVAAGTATITYTVTGTGGCANATATRTVTVTAPVSAGTLSGTQSICVNGTTTFASTVSGGSWSSSAAGVATVNDSTGVVTGVAAGTATITYTVIGTGGCANATATRTVTVNSNNTITLSSASGTNTQTVTAGTAITNITYNTTGATGAAISGLPAGVTGSWASNVVTISGTPSATGTFSYTVTMNGGCTGGNNTATGSITVNSSGSGSPGSR